VLVVGHTSVKWDDFVAKARKFANQTHEPGETKSTIFGNLLFLNDIRTKYTDFQTNKGERGSHPIHGTSLLELVILTRHLQATDPRDKLYALIGMANGVRSSDWEVIPNYNLSAAEVYRLFALWYITRRRNIEMFSLGARNQITSPSLSEIPLPSWVPDLTRLDPGTPLPKLPYLSSGYIDLRYTFAESSSTDTTYTKPVPRYFMQTSTTAE
jgi:hypothetical protein